MAFTIFANLYFLHVFASYMQKSMSFVKVIFPALTVTSEWHRCHNEIGE